MGKQTLKNSQLINKRALSQPDSLTEGQSIRQECHSIDIQTQFKTKMILRVICPNYRIEKQEIRGCPWKENHSFKCWRKERGGAAIKTIRNRTKKNRINLKRKLSMTVCLAYIKRNLHATMRGLLNWKMEILKKARILMALNTMKGLVVATRRITLSENVIIGELSSS